MNFQHSPAGLVNDLGLFGNIGLNQALVMQSQQQDKHQMMLNSSLYPETSGIMDFNVLGQYVPNL